MALWKLTKYPCIFDIEDKIIVHYTERNALSSPFSTVSVANFFTI